MKLLNVRVVVLILIIQVFFCFYNIPVNCDQELALQIDFDKEAYSKGEDIEISLKFTGVNDEKINSLALSLEYDNAIFESKTNNVENNIISSYIPFNHKYIGDGECGMLFASPNDIALQNDVSIAKIHLKVKETAITGSTQIKLSIKDDMLDSQTNIYKVKGDSLTEILIEESEQISSPLPSSEPHRSGETVRSKIGLDKPIPSEMFKEIVFSDINEHWAKEDIIFMASQEFVMGVDEYSFKPDDYITRAEFAALIVRVLKLESVSYTGRFNDIVPGAWYENVVGTAAQASIIAGYNGYFKPNDNVTREEMTKMIVKAFEYSGNQIQNQDSNIIFADETQISDWAIDYVKAAYSFGFIKGINNNEFAPKENATRAQAVTIIRRLMNYL